MPIKKNNIKEKYKEFVQEVTLPLTEDVITKVLIIGQSNASALTPIDTSNLINSQYRRVERSGSRWTGKVGYTADYAAWVHEMPGTLKSRPRSGVDSFVAYKGTSEERTAFASNTGNFWDPDAEPKFLLKGFERDGAEEIARAIIDGYSKAAKRKISDS